MTELPQHLVSSTYSWLTCCQPYMQLGAVGSQLTLQGGAEAVSAVALRGAEAIGALYWGSVVLLLNVICLAHLFLCMVQSAWTRAKHPVSST